MNYLLDTNAVVALLRNKPTTVRERYRKAEASGDYLALSSVVLFELWYGVAKSSHVPENTERLRILLSGNLDLLDFDDEDAKTAGQVRAVLEKGGNPIGAYDLLIAGQALRRGLTVVTAKTDSIAVNEQLSRVVTSLGDGTVVYFVGRVAFDERLAVAQRVRQRCSSV